RPTLHLEGLARMVREDEDRHAVRRLLAPPALPALIGPRSTHRAEHVAAQDPGAEVLEALFRHRIVDAGLTPFEVKHRLAEHAGREEPPHQLLAPYPERVLQ